jgi:predicted GIY-YIG superfamily endonuclease
MVYVLLLEGGKYYIGYSADESGRRIGAHYRGAGAVWTMLHRPIETIEIIPEGDKALEMSLTAQYARQYGWNNVRGGAVMQTNAFGLANG